MGKAVPISVPIWHNRVLQWVLALLLAIGASLWPTGLFRQDLINPGGWGQFWQFWQASLHPDLSPATLHLTLAGTLTTLAYAICGTCLSLILGLLGGILTSEVWWLSLWPSRHSQRITPIWLSLRGLLAIPRSIHELIWGLFFVHLWGLDPLTAILAIAIPYGTITAKVFSEILDETPRQPLLALLNSGVSPPTALVYTLLPQAFLNLLSYAFYRFECSIRSAAVLGVIGAGGLGYQILLSLQSLRYAQLWTFFYALIGLNGLIDFGSAWLRRRLNCATRLDLNLRAGRSPVTHHPGPRPQPADRWLWLLGFATLLSMPLAFHYIGADFRKLWSLQTLQRLGEISRATFPPDWSVCAQLGPISGETLAMSVLAIAIAGTGGLFLAFFAADRELADDSTDRNRRGWSIGSWAGFCLSRLFLLVCRAIPAPIWALVMLFVLFPGILPGAIALGIHNLGILGRLKAEVVENLDPRPLVALKAQGATGPQIFLYGILPLSLPRFLAYDLYRWEVCLRETVIVGLVGAGGLGRLLTEQLSSFDYRALIITLSGFVLLTFGVDWVSAQARRSLR